MKLTRDALKQIIKEELAEMEAASTQSTMAEVEGESQAVPTYKTKPVAAAAIQSIELTTDHIMKAAQSLLEPRDPLLILIDNHVQLIKKELEKLSTTVG